MNSDCVRWSLPLWVLGACRQLCALVSRGCGQELSLGVEIIIFLIKKMIKNE